MATISKKLLNDLSGNTKLQEAMALALLVKQNYRSSTIKNFSYNKLSEITLRGYSYNKTLITLLEERGLVTRCGKKNEHLVFKNLKSNKWRKACIEVKSDEAADFASMVKHVQCALCTLVLYKKLFISDIITALQGYYNSYRAINRLNMSIKKIKKYAYKYNLYHLVCDNTDGTNKTTLKDFVDNGVSYDYWRKLIGCSKQHLLEVLIFGEEHGYFIRQTRCFDELYFTDIVVRRGVSNNGATYFHKSEQSVIDAYYALDETDRKKYFITKHGMYRKLANLYYLPEHAPSYVKYDFEQRAEQGYARIHTNRLGQTFHKLYKYSSACMVKNDMPNEDNASQDAYTMSTACVDGDVCMMGMCPTPATPCTTLDSPRQQGYDGLGTI